MAFRLPIYKFTTNDYQLRGKVRELHMQSYMVYLGPKGEIIKGEKGVDGFLDVMSQVLRFNEAGLCIFESEQHFSGDSDIPSAYSSTYDTRGRLTEIHKPPGFIRRFDYSQYGGREVSRIEEKHYDRDGGLSDIFEFVYESLQVRKCWRRSSGKIVNKEVFTYDEHGKLLAEESYGVYDEEPEPVDIEPIIFTPRFGDGDSSFPDNDYDEEEEEEELVLGQEYLENAVEYKYEETNHLLEEHYLDDARQLVQKITYLNDVQGNPVSMISHSHEDINAYKLYEYVYDARGNWIKRIELEVLKWKPGTLESEDSVPKCIVEREISYYD